MTDAAKLPLMLTELRMPTIGRLWQEFGARADKEGWGAARFLAVLCEHELAERATRRIARHLAQSALPPGKTLETFDFAAAPSIRKAHIAALATGNAWIEPGANILIFGPSGTGKTHVAAAIGAGLIDHGYRALFSRTTDLVQKLQAARRDLLLPASLALPSSTSSIASSSMIWATFGRIRLRPPCSSNSSPSDTSARASSSPAISRSASGTRSSPIQP
jgi:DNA replication protein DnaC